MRQPSAPKKPLAPAGDPVGDVLDRLERKMGRPALKAAMQRWRQLGDLHKISADIMADSGIKGRDKMLALQVAADSLVSKGKATQDQATDAEEEMADEVGDTAGRERTPFSSTNDFDDEDGKTDPDARPLGAQVGGNDDGDGDDGRSPEWDEDAETDRGFGGPQETDDEVPDDLLHGDGSDGTAGDRSPPEEAEGDETMRGTLVNDEGKRIPVVITYDDGEGASVSSEQGESFGPYEGFNLEVANGVLTQDAFDDLEEDGWNLVAQADDSQSDADAEGGDEEEPPEGEGDEGGDEEDEPDDRPGSTRAGGGEYPAYVPEPDEEGDRFERAMFELVDRGGLGEDSPLWGQLRGAKDSIDAHRIIKASGLPTGLHKYALVVARAIFDNTGRDFDSGEARNEGRLAALYGIAESPLLQQVDFDQESGLKRVFGWAGRSR